MHKDQRRIRGALLPHILDRVLSETPGAERDCTILNRLFLQGPDPLFLMETCQPEFGLLCDSLGIAEADGRSAIEHAHWQGPGVLLVGTGVPLDGPLFDPAVVPFGEKPRLPAEWRAELLWLVLASVSETTEEDYKPEITLTERVRVAMRAGIQLAFLMEMSSPLDEALGALRKFDAKSVWTDDANGIPVCDEDAGFYIGYKKGWKVCGVRHGDKVFYGTVPGTTLDEQGVKVDEKVSESYGFVRVCP